MHRRLLLLTHGTRSALILTILTGFLAGLLAIGQSYALSSTIDAVFLRSWTLSLVWPWLRAMLAIIVARAGLAWVNELSASSIAVRIKTDLRERLFEHILALGPAYARGERSGELTTTAVEGIDALDAYFSQYLPQLVVSTLVPVAILLIVFPLDLLSGVILLVTAPLIPLFMYMIGRGAEIVTRRQYDTLSRLSAHFLDSLQGLTTLKLFGQSRAQARNIAMVGDQYRDATLKVLQVTFLSAFVLELLATISTAIIAVEVGLRLLYGQMQFQQALFLLILAPEFYLPLRMLGLRFHAGMAGTSAARRIFEVLDSPAPAAANPGAEYGVRYEPRHDRVSAFELHNISYSYPGEHTPALQNVSLQVGPGEHIAVVGPSGAGKTTLASILLRFIEPSTGSITLNGKPISDMPLDEWRALFAWVPQNPHLFHDTIAGNIRMGNPMADDEHVAAAARAAHLEDFIESLPEKYGTPIGEAGARLSSGQAQRLALARAFLKNAPILIMDEPTSSVDPETEALLEDSTRRLMQGRMVITIAHRLNTVMHAHEILVLDSSEVAERGTHRELLHRNGLYAQTVGIQDNASPSVSSPPELLSGVHSEQLERQLRPPSSTPPRAGSKPEVSGHSQGKPSSIFLRLLAFLDGSWRWVALSILLGSLTIGSGIALMGTSAWLISTAALHPSIAALELAVVGVRFFGIARAAFRYLERLVSHNVTFRLLGRLRAWFYESLEPLAPARLMEYRAGDLLARVIGDVNTLEAFYVRALAPPATAFLVGIAASVFLARSAVMLVAGLMASFLLLGLVLPIILQALSTRIGRDLVTQRAHLNASLVDSIQGLPDILAFGQGGARLAQIRTDGRRNGQAQRQMSRIGGLNGAAFTFFANLAPWLVLVLAIPEVASGHIRGVMLAPLVLVTASTFEAVAPLPLAAQTWSSTRAAARRLFELVDAEPAIAECAPRIAPSPTAIGTARLEFDTLSFRYATDLEPALRNISFRLEPGQRFAIVGPSGAGKSTLVSLLLRFWDYQCGEIYLNRRSIKDYSPDEVRRHIAVVSPNTYFFNTSVYENLLMSRRGVSRSEVERAANQAQIHDFIERLPRGYDTLIGEQGLRLSGGERQRLAIARAILKEAPLLILDEPTANLDAIVESQVLESLFRSMEGKSVLLITHRLIGLERTDEILVMEHGCIAERGTQAGLLGRDGAYRRLWDLQARFLEESTEN
jgi:ATP-binding cassette, subfamily C, bacterial CydCD